ncbi:DUF6444 domain-containing protein [Frankia sp. Cj3]|uniref:DUF6444 domain-containing protein n=1 Tax=Frankia sp. Cj3 TaxID=2880976 RepID=UPI00351CEC90
MRLSRRSTVTELLSASDNHNGTARVADLERKASRNSRNSSLSPSTDDAIPGWKPPEPPAGGTAGAMIFTRSCAGVGVATWLPGP